MCDRRASGQGSRGDLELARAGRTDLACATVLSKGRVWWACGACDIVQCAAMASLELGRAASRELVGPVSRRSDAARDSRDGMGWTGQTCPRVAVKRRNDDVLALTRT